MSNLFRLARQGAGKGAFLPIQCKGGSQAPEDYRQASGIAVNFMNTQFKNVVLDFTSLSYKANSAQLTYLTQFPLALSSASSFGTDTKAGTVTELRLRKACVMVSISLNITCLLRSSFQDEN